jgi:hypothetical protein
MRSLAWAAWCSTPSAAAISGTCSPALSRWRLAASTWHRPLLGPGVSASAAPRATLCRLVFPRPSDRCRVLPWKITVQVALAPSPQATRPWRALDGDLCTATECPARGGRPGHPCWRGSPGRVGAGTGCLRVRGLPTGGSAAPGGLPPVGRGRPPPRSRHVPLLPAWLLAAPLTPVREPPVTSASPHAIRTGPGPAWRAEGVR